MSVSYVAEASIYTEVSVSDINNDFAKISHSVQFVNDENDTNSVGISYSNDKKLIFVSFYGYREQKKIDMILKAFSLMLGVKFVYEDDFDFEKFESEGGKVN